MDPYPSPATRAPAVDTSSVPYPSQSPSLPHHRSASRQSSTSSIHSIKRKPVPTEFDQLKQLGNELLGNDSQEREEILDDNARPNFLPHSSGSQSFDHPLASTSISVCPPAPTPSTLSRHPSTSSRPLSPSNIPPASTTSYSLQPNSLRPSSRSGSSSSSASSHASQSVFGSPPQGIIGTTLPRELIRIERDYSSGTGIVQFWPGWIWELEGRVSPTIYQTILNDLNLILARAHDPYKSIFDNVLAVLSLWISPLILTSHFQKEMNKLDECLQRVNREHLNPVGLNLLNPEKNAFLFLELEYY